jgi:hypothetical protein
VAIKKIKAMGVLTMTKKAFDAYWLDKNAKKSYYQRGKAGNDRVEETWGSA